MPFTKHPFDYPINRLLMNVGLVLHSMLLYQPPILIPEDRRRFEKLAAEYLELDIAVEAELLRTYHFRWNRDGTLRTIHLVPHDKVRRTPGIKILREMFFSRNSQNIF